MRRDVALPYLTETVLPHVLAEVAKVSDMRGREGGVFVLMQADTQELIVPPMVVGAITNGKQEKYAQFAREKASRLLEHTDHCLSWESRDPDNEKWGGALHDGLFIWSFSGLSEEQDEAFVLMAAHLSGRVRNGTPKTVSEISGNQIILGNPYLFWMPKVAEAETDEAPCPSCGGTGGDDDDCCDYCGGSGRKSDFRVPKV